MTNSEYFSRYCNWEDDMRFVIRMAKRVFQQRGVENAPVWEREHVFDEWLKEEFDPVALALAKNGFNAGGAGASYSGTGLNPNASHAGQPARIRKLV